jgi:hypothetical protein
MLNGICPKCGSEEVYSGANRSRKTNGYGMNAIPIKRGFFEPSKVALDNYVCIRCGYVESYISNRQKLDEIAENWSKVPRGS